MFSTNFRAALYLVVSMAGFAINDAFVKSIGHTINLGQLLLVRGMLASLMLLLLLMHYRLLPATRHVLDRTLLARNGFELLGTLAFLTALRELPFANIYAIMQALPLVVTVGAVLFFREQVGYHRWLAIALGLAGVMLIIRPGMAGFNSYSLLVVLVVIVAAGRDLLTRRLAVDIPSLVVSLYSSLLITLTGLVLLQPLGGWQSMSTPVLLKLLGAAIFIILGYQFIVLAMRTGEISSVASFRYSGLVWALLIGYFVFGEIPDSITVLGAITVVLTGLYMLYRERLVAARQAAGKKA